VFSKTDFIAIFNFFLLTTFFVSMSVGGFFPFSHRHSVFLCVPIGLRCSDTCVFIHLKQNSSTKTRWHDPLISGFLYQIKNWPPRCNWNIVEIILHRNGQSRSKISSETETKSIRRTHINNKSFIFLDWYIHLIKRCEISLILWVKTSTHTNKRKALLNKMNLIWKRAIMYLCVSGHVFVC
jgi:hypothetical protein